MHILHAWEEGCSAVWGSLEQKGHEETPIENRARLYSYGDVIGGAGPLISRTEPGQHRYGFHGAGRRIFQCRRPELPPRDERHLARGQQARSFGRFGGTKHGAVEDPVYLRRLVVFGRRPYGEYSDC